ncbi:MAG: Stf0 family sulfotransferase [Xanthobacteraceae bacterium]
MTFFPKQEKLADRGYAICTMPRSGSNFLCQLLASSGCLGRPLEYFNGPESPVHRRSRGSILHRCNLIFVAVGQQPIGRQPIGACLLGSAGQSSKLDFACGIVC